MGCLSSLPTGADLSTGALKMWTGKCRTNEVPNARQKTITGKWGTETARLETAGPKKHSAVTMLYPGLYNAKTESC